MFTLTPKIKYKFAVLMLCMTFLLPLFLSLFLFLTFGLCPFSCVSSGNSPSFLACHPDVLEPTAPGPAFLCGFRDGGLVWDLSPCFSRLPRLSSPVVPPPLGWLGEAANITSSLNNSVVKGIVPDTWSARKIRFLNRTEKLPANEASFTGYYATGNLKRNDSHFPA